MTYASANGYISLFEGSQQYQAATLPDPNIPYFTIAPFFDDLESFGNTTLTQGIFYQTTATSVTYEYYVGRPENAAAITHFTVAYSDLSPGIFTYTYYQTSGNNGAYATVGMQGREYSPLIPRDRYARGSVG